MPADPQNQTAVASHRQRRIFRVLATLVIILAFANALIWFWQLDIGQPTVNKNPSAKKNTTLAASFTGTSDKLSRTGIVPTLESPIPPGKSAIWCASLLFAWHQMEKDVLKGPLVLEDAEELSQRLSKSPTPEIRPEDTYVAAGLVEEGIVDRIRRELPLRFPKAPELTWVPPHPKRGALAYAYLEVALRFGHPFVENNEPIHFQEDGGKEGKEIAAFGIPEAKARAGLSTYRKQVEVLFDEDGEFAVDPDRHSKPYQIVLARLKHPATLQKALETLEEKTKKGKGAVVGLDGEAVLLMPFMHWRIEHVFSELSNKEARRPTIPDFVTLEVAQSIDFRLDPSGAAVASGARLPADWNGSTHLKLLFDRPFLVVFKTREQNRPIFAFWVDNAELLQPWPPRREVKP